MGAAGTAPRVTRAGMYGSLRHRPEARRRRHALIGIEQREQAEKEEMAQMAQLARDVRSQMAQVAFTDPESSAKPLGWGKLKRYFKGEAAFRAGAARSSVAVPRKSVAP